MRCPQADKRRSMTGMRRIILGGSRRSTREIEVAVSVPTIYLRKSPAEELLDRALLLLKKVESEKPNAQMG